MSLDPNATAGLAHVAHDRVGDSIAGMRVDAGSYATTTARVIAWARAGQPRYICVANVHMVMETRDSAEYRQVVNGADLVTSDGMPLVWILRRRGFAAERVYGPTLMLHICGAAAAEGIPIGLFGGAPAVLERACQMLQTRFPGLQIAARISPPFGALTADQNRAYADELRQSGARIVFVGLGCPKQERWMAAVYSQVPAVFLGVGAAFNFHAGEVRQAPAWLQRMGMEWAFRLAAEPRRLWRRYLWHNPRFIWAVLGEEISRKFTRR